MTTSFYNGVSGLKIFQNGLDVWGDNIANVNTTGFKENIPEFGTLFSETLNSTPISSDLGMGGYTQATSMNTSLGSFQQTDNTFDMAIAGDGWFGIDYNGQKLYTRDGSFKRDRDGNLVNDSGAYLLVANANNIEKTENGYSINRDIDTNNLVDKVQNLTPISLPNDLVLPAVATKNVSLSLNLNDDDIIETTAPAKEDSDFSVLYNQNGEDMKIRDGDSFIVGYGGNATYNDRIEYQICIGDDTQDNQDVHYDFTVNNRHIQLTLPDGASKQETQQALKEKLDNAGIHSQITDTGIMIFNPNKLIIKSNTPLVDDVAVAKLTYKKDPSNEYEFNTIKSFEDIVQSLASSVYGDDAVLSFDENNGQIVMFNNSINKTINSLSFL